MSVTFVEKEKKQIHSLAKYIAIFAGFLLQGGGFSVNEQEEASSFFLKDIGLWWSIKAAMFAS